eukprot:TRINITY_DN17595_c0_g1_i1.p2 TRINITY_DN17595_c0_g1~~TRINITY_DN17595_c0_g1_i1.p2  ORF type:complete len:186 (-),score=25.73 TRINITY_DN17595_c0_g1_i1:22-543(-)
MPQTGIPAVEVSNGFVRVGSLVTIKAGEAKGSVASFSLPDHTVTVHLADGSEVTVAAVEVARQNPRHTGTPALRRRGAPSAEARACVTRTSGASSGLRSRASPARGQVASRRPLPPGPPPPRLPPPLPPSHPTGAGSPFGHRRSPTRFPRPAAPALSSRTPPSHDAPDSPAAA